MTCFHERQGSRLSEHVVRYTRVHEWTSGVVLCCSPLPLPCFILSLKYISRKCWRQISPSYVTYCSCIQPSGLLIFKHNSHLLKFFSHGRIYICPYLEHKWNKEWKVTIKVIVIMLWNPMDTLNCILEKMQGKAECFYQLKCLSPWRNRWHLVSHFKNIQTRWIDFITWHAKFAVNQEQKSWAWFMCSSHKGSWSCLRQHHQQILVGTNTVCCLHDNNPVDRDCKST